MSQGPSYDLILWDFDGCLADTFSCAVRTFNRLAPEFGYRPLNDAGSVRHMSLPALLRHCDVPLLKLPFLVRRILGAMREEMGGVRLFPGVPEVLQSLHRDGKPMSILSSNSEPNIRICLKANGVEELFDTVVGYQRLFGKARGIRRFLRQRGLLGRPVLYVGDEVRDIEAARQAGIDVAAVTWGFQSSEVLAEAGPDFLVTSPDELVSLGGR